LSFRLARKERDLRSTEARLKQYETEISDLKARNEALVFDNNRKTDDNVVSKDFGTFSGKDLYISL
jgi:hypothetical protein